MKKKILYSILNEWRDEDMDDSPIDLDDDMDIKHGSSDMDNEPDLDDDDFALSTTQKTSYEYFPKTKEELKKIIRMEIEKQGGVDVDLNMIDTSKITNMNYIFFNCKSLRTLDVSEWNVSNVTNMLGVFCGCESLETLDVSEWNVSNVNDMFSMFYDCKSLRTLDVSKWKVSNKMMNMGHMFCECESLETLDVSGWDVSNVNDMKYMFYKCKSLHTDTTMWKINTKCIIIDTYKYAPYIKHN